MYDRIINVAIVAHVDHGKTTLVDNLLKQSGAIAAHQNVGERVMDRNALEQERGITILSKVTGVLVNKNNARIKINIIDTPGHADFGGEVERILSMADLFVLLVDSAEGPMPQTKFVLTKALKANLNPIVIINKVDRTDRRPAEVNNEIIDLFLNLEANDEQLDFPILYASGREGWCIAPHPQNTKIWHSLRLSEANDMGSSNIDIDKLEKHDFTASENSKDSLQDCLEQLETSDKNLYILFKYIIERAPQKNYKKEAPFSMLVSLMEADKFLGRVLIGRVYQGTAKTNILVKALKLTGELVETAKLTKLQTFLGLQRVSVEEVDAGDIVAIAGMEKGSVSDTIADNAVLEPLPSTPVDPPTMAITVSVNDSPLAGTEGTKLTSRVIRDRLINEAATNVAVKVRDIGDGSFEVSGRGELQLGVLVENMRREGFELSVSRPRVVFKYEGGTKLEPIEELVIDVDEEFSGKVMESLNYRKGELESIHNFQNGRVRLIYLVPSRALIGYHGEFLTDTRGTGLMNHVFHSYAEYKGKMANRNNGVLISMNQGEAVAYAIFNLQDRGIMFIKPQDKVYPGMIIGQHNRDNDLEVNVLKAKQLTNIRAAGTDEAIKLTPPKILNLEEMIAYINNDELVEVTPKSLRLRKALLDPNARKRAARSNDD